MKPLRDYVLIEKIHEEMSAGGIILPDGTDTGDLCSGVITDIGPQISPMEENINVGSKIFFIRDQNLSNDKKESIIHISKILAVDDESYSPKDQSFPIDKLNWEEYKTESYEDFWKELTNFRSFKFNLKYMKPFVKITNFQRELYESIVKHITSHLIGSNATIVLTGDKDKDEIGFIIADDIYGGKVELDVDSISFTFEKDDLQAIINKLPYYMSALSSIASSPLFNRIFGKTFNRVTRASFQMEQIIKIVGKGRHASTPVTNKEVIQRLVKLGKAYKSKDSVMDCLSPIADSIGRVDLVFSFERQIEGHQYTIFVKLQAPTNQDSTYLWTELDIQDHTPGLIAQRDYTPIVTEFIRNSYFETFLKELFGDIYCTTLGSK
jgi:co-chaperonin GroES (HSP10)